MADEIYMIKNGKIKLKVDISDFLIDEDASIFLSTVNNEDLHDDEHNNLQFNRDLIFPFIIYVEGSYFGDSDILKQKKPYLRDSTAVVEEISSLFVLSREFLMSLRRSFGREI